MSHAPRRLTFADRHAAIPPLARECLTSPRVRFSTLPHAAESTIARPFFARRALVKSSRGAFRSIAILLGLLLSLASARAQSAQSAAGPLLQPAGRVDVFVSSITAVQAGAELSALAGRYMRVAAVGGLGGSWNEDSSGLSARVEVIGRFMLDPDFRTRWAPYAAGGLGARYDDIHSGWRATLIIALGVEGPNWDGVVPFFEAGYGGGARLGLGLRKTRPRGR